MRVQKGGGRRYGHRGGKIDEIENRREEKKAREKERERVEFRRCKRRERKRGRMNL